MSKPDSKQSNTKDMTPAEFDLMKVLWRLGSATVAEVRTAAKGQAAYTTVMTLLGRLEKKAAVAVDKSRQPFVYRPRIKRGSVLKRRLRSFLDSVFDGEADSLIMQLVAQDALSAEELRELGARIDASTREEEE